jgi:hypothetical protein
MKKCIYLSLLVFFISCSKDSNIFYQDGHTQHRSNDVCNDRTRYTQTMIGEEINNPFEINNLRQAQESLCDGIFGEIEPTHQLIKFTRLNSSQLKLLGIDSSLVLLDYPFNHKVIEMGDYYQEPGLSKDEIQSFYSVVKTDKAFPEGIHYEVIEEYNYDYTYPLLLVESFRITNNFEYVNDYVRFEDFVQNGNTFCDKVLNPGDDCPEGCTKILVPDDAPPFYKWECDCSGGSNGGSNGGSTGGPGGGHLNACNCPIPSDPEIPAGCIQVVTDSAPEGVNTIQVLVADNWGQFLFPHKTWTDANGCWRVNARMNRNVWVWTKFLNSHSFERAARTEGAIWEFLLPIKDYIGKYGEPHNNIYTLYRDGTSIKEYILWGAATAINQVQVFNGLASAQGINILPSILDVWITPLTTSGATLMMNQAGNIGGISGIPNPAIFPDISLGIRSSRSRQNSLAYHEFAHASHYTLVGPSWWGKLIEAELANASSLVYAPSGMETFQFSGDPYGNGTRPLDRYIAVAESWSEHIEESFTDSNGEFLTFGNGYIPEGLFEDLRDSGPEALGTGIIG